MTCDHAVGDVLFAKGSVFFVGSFMPSAQTHDELEDQFMVAVYALLSIRN